MYISWVLLFNFFSYFYVLMDINFKVLLLLKIVFNSYLIKVLKVDSFLCISWWIFCLGFLVDFEENVIKI